MTDQSISYKEALMQLQDQHAKLQRRIGEMGGAHAHIHLCLDEVNIPRSIKVHRRVELACLELQQVRLRERSLKVQLDAVRGEQVLGAMQERST